MERFLVLGLAKPESAGAVDLLRERHAVISGVARLGFGQPGDLSFCDREPAAELAQVSAGAIIFCTEELVDVLQQRYPGVVCVPLPDPRSAFIDLGHDLLARAQVEVSSEVERPFGIHSTVRLGAQTVVHPEARIDAGVEIGAHCVVHRGSWIQAGAIIRDNTVIGVEGINAYKGLDGKQRNFPHFGSVFVGENTEIGAGVVIMRGILNSTRIGSNSIIGNLCNIGHGVEIGTKVWMSVGCLIGGHTRIRDGATLGMGVTVRDNIEIGVDTQVGMGSVVVKSVAASVSVFGNPARVMAPIQAGPSR